MTKEQRERLHDHHASEALEWDEYASGASAYSSREDSRKMAAMHRAALELLTDRAEADRVLGARVRAAIQNPDFVMNECWDQRDADPVFDAIAAVFREEGER